MRQFVFAAVGAVSLFPAISSADDSAHYQAEALPYVQAALTTQMPILGDRAMKTAPQDALSLGLAMLAGRTGAIKSDDTGDFAQLQALETRAGPFVQAYLKSHPGTDAGRVNWPIVVHETQDEANYVEHYLQVHSADYWLEHAIYAIDANEVVMPRQPTDDPQKNSRSTLYDTMQPNKAIDTHLIMAAAQCVVAARRETGIDYQTWVTLPLVVRLLQRLPRMDMQARVDSDIASKRTDLNYSTGAAACGTDEQFKADVAALKAAS